MTLAELFSKPGTWCQGAYARDKRGRKCNSPMSKGAVQYCLIGAAHRYGTCDTKRIICMAFPDPVQGAMKWNDTFGRTQAEVQALCERLGI